MINILTIRSTPRTKGAGIDVYCQALKQLFSNDDKVCFKPIQDYEVINFKILKSFFKWKQFFTSIKTSKADIIHINEYATFTALQAFIAARLLKKPIIYTAHWHPFKQLRHPLLAKLFFYLLLKNQIKRNASTVITLNSEDTAFFQKFHHNVVRIPHWIRFNINTEISTIPKQKNLILFVGRAYDINKGIEHLYALPEGKYEIHIVGAGKLRKRKDFIQHINIPTTELQELYAKASLLVVPSKYEAFSYVSLEALAYKTPVVMSERVRLADYLDNYKWGKTFKYGDHEDFIKSVEETIGSNVDKSLLEVFNKDKIKDIYKNIYLSAANRQ